MAVRDIYTEADFGSMGWHDCHIHAIALEPLPSEPGRLLLDIDYLVEWLRAGSGDQAAERSWSARPPWSSTTHPTWSPTST